ncbi:MAG: hypothetical protein NXY57DRAFT_970375, partial [Lentinula lateritia]
MSTLPEAIEEEQQFGYSTLFTSDGQPVQVLTPCREQLPVVTPAWGRSITRIDSPILQAIARRMGNNLNAELLHILLVTHLLISGDSRPCVSVLACRDLEEDSAPLPRYKCQACSSQSLKCLGSLDVELAMDALNALHTTSTSSIHNLANSLRQGADLNDQLKQIGSLFDMAKELFLRSILDLQNAGEDPIVILKALKAAKPNHWAINLTEWTIMATLFRWPSPFHLSGLDFDNRTPGKSTAHIDNNGHLVESSPPPDLAAEVFEDLNKVEKGSMDKDTISKVGGFISIELDLPSIESLAEPTL